MHVSAMLCIYVAHVHSPRRKNRILLGRESVRVENKGRNSE